MREECTKVLERERLSHAADVERTKEEIIEKVPSRQSGATKLYTFSLLGAFPPHPALWLAVYLRASRGLLDGALNSRALRALE